MEMAWPKLVERFNELCNQEGLFPLMTKTQEENYISRLNWNDVNSREAAVLVLLATVDDKPSILFTKRAPHLHQHAAEISFPGGHFDAAKDVTLIDTALRETQEELLPSSSLLQASVEIVGQATRLPSLNGTPVTPVVAVLWKDLTNESLSKIFPGDASEVDEVFSASLHELIANETAHELPQNRFGMTSAPRFPTANGDIWGLTALILRPVLHRLLKPVFFSAV
jgi:NUDIX domain